MAFKLQHVSSIKWPISLPSTHPYCTTTTWREAGWLQTFMLWTPNSEPHHQNTEGQIEAFQNWQHFCSCFRWGACANCGLGFLRTDGRGWQPVWSLSAVAVTHPPQGWRRLVQYHSLKKPQRRLRVETDQQFLRSSETGRPTPTGRRCLSFPILPLSFNCSRSSWPRLRAEMLALAALDCPISSLC